MRAIVREARGAEPHERRHGNCGDGAETAAAGGAAGRARAAHRGKAYSGGAGRGNRQAASAARADGVTGQRGG